MKKYLCLILLLLTVCFAWLTGCDRIESPAPSPSETSIQSETAPMVAEVESETSAETASAEMSTQPETVPATADVDGETASTPALHEHIFADVWTVDVPATCIVEGSQSRHCTLCDARTDVTALPALMHTVEITPERPATFAHLGLTEGKHCSSCGAILEAQEEIPALGGNVDAGTDYYDGDEKVTYRYNYSLSLTENDRFTMSTLIIGSDASHELRYDEGKLNYIGHSVYELLFDGEHEAMFVRFHDGRFEFCNRDGSQWNDKRDERPGGMTDRDLTPREGHSSHGYYDLANNHHGSAMQELYYQLHITCEGFTKNMGDIRPKGDRYVIDYVDISHYLMTADEAVSVWKIFYLENPCYYWLSNSVSIVDGKLELCIDEAYASADERRACDEAIDALVAASAQIVTDDMDDFALSLTLHDFLIDSMDYAYQADGVTPEDEIWAHNMIGCARYRTGVCESYAKTYMFLCRLYGLDCLIVSGDANGKHAWNQVSIDGNWYAVDCTWDETNTENISYACFGMSQDALHAGHTPDDSKGYGVDYLYDLPDLSQVSIELVTLYKNDTRLGLFLNIDMAFAAMIDKEASYTIELFPYRYTGPLLMATPVVQHHIHSTTTPEVKRITILGDHVSAENGVFLSTPLFLGESLTLRSDLELREIALIAPYLDLGNHTLITGGYYCQIEGNGVVFDKKTDGISIDVHTTYETMFYNEVHVHRIHHDPTTGGNVYLRGASHIEVFQGNNLQLYGSLDTPITVDRFIADKRGSYHAIGIREANVAIGSIEYETGASPLNPLRLTTTFTSLETVPDLRLGEVKGKIELVVSGSVTYMETDMAGNEINRYTVSVEPFMLVRPVAYLGTSTDLENLSIVFIMWNNGTGFDHECSEHFSLDADGGLVMTGVELIDNLYYVKNGVLLRYIGKSTDFVIPSGITAIADYAFFACKDVQSLTIPASVKEIGDNVCMYCTSLTDVRYEGTTAQWEEISTAARWLSDVPISEIICSDGRVPR